ENGWTACQIFTCKKNDLITNKSVPFLLQPTIASASGCVFEVYERNTCASSCHYFLCARQA
ncbi:Hypothetical predicted protein, partial [Paramuricea clavata]